jgi:hypothetical protein
LPSPLATIELSMNKIDAVATSTLVVWAGLPTTGITKGDDYRRRSLAATGLHRWLIASADSQQTLSLPAIIIVDNTSRSGNSSSKKHSIV